MNATNHRILALLLLLSPLFAGAQEESPTDGDNRTAQGATAQPDSLSMRLEALKQQPLEGEKLELDVAGETVFALFKAQTLGTRRGAVLLLHDSGSHPDAPGVIHPLRIRLADAGWSTLSLTMIQPEETGIDAAWLERGRERIAAGLNELQQRQLENIALIGHGSGARAAVDYLAAGPQPLAKGLVLVSMTAKTSEDPALDTLGKLARLELPILDIYGTLDTPAASTNAEQRRLAAQQRGGSANSAHTVFRDVALAYSDRKGDSVNYRQVPVTGANHNFDRQSPLLSRRVRGWLQRHLGNN